MNATNTRFARGRSALYTVVTACVAFGTCAAVQAGEYCATVAQAAPGARAVTVHYHDLNLSSPEGASALYTRINYAAHAVCDAGGDRSLFALKASYACERAAIAHAVQSVHSPQLAALVATKMPQG